MKRPEPKEKEQLENPSLDFLEGKLDHDKQASAECPVDYWGLLFLMVRVIVKKSWVGFWIQDHSIGFLSN